MEFSKTTKALASITDTGMFERLATAVLREANFLYEALIHTGVNLDGHTIRAPLDGITFIRGAKPPHMVSVHHTIGDRDRLKTKWLHDPALVQSRKPNATKSSPGDILKTVEIFNDERKRTPDLKGTLVLTANSEPHQDTIRDAEAIANAAGIEIDFWPASRIAHFLDINPEGQYIRKKYLCITQERLSRSLFRDISRISLDLLSLPDDKDDWIDRNIDHILKANLRSGVTIISANSGQGKSVACYKQLTDHISNDGYGLILPHDILSKSYTIEQALSRTLHVLHPSLAEEAGSEALSLATTITPIMIVVEDINKSGKASSLLEKLINWHKKAISTKTDIPWQILCPTWPQFIASINEDIRKTANELVVDCPSFSPKEGTYAVENKYVNAGRSITSLEAEEIAMALGYDPLLIALHDLNEKPVASNTIRNFINNKMVQLSNERNGFTASEYLQSILSLCTKMFENLNMQPLWSDIEKYGLASDQLQMLRDLTHQRQLIWLAGDAEQQLIIFRHDRIRDWFAAKAFAQCLSEGSLSDDIVSEPYFAKIIGLSLSTYDSTVEVVALIKSLNPLALFHSLQNYSVAESESQKAIVASIDEWLDDDDTNRFSNMNLRIECLNVLSLTESRYVLKFLKGFKDRTWAYYRAGFRNGDLGMGIELCRRVSLDFHDTAHEALIQYVLDKNRNQIIAAIKKLLNRDDIEIEHRSGILRLCGYIRDEDLYNILQKSWDNENESDRVELLADYLWACAHCCGNSPSRLLDPIIDTWASLPAESDKEGWPSDKENIAAHGIHWSFQRHVPISAIEYLVARAGREELRWEISYMLNGIDHPSAVVHSANYLAELQMKITDNNSFSPFVSMAADEWRRFQEKFGRSMSNDSKNHLYKLWSDPEVGGQLRIQALKLWSATIADTDLASLRLFEEDEILGDYILEQRVKRGDTEAVPQLIKKISVDSFWWYATRYVWTDELTDELNRELVRRSSHSSDKWDDSLYELDSKIYRFFARLPIETAESLLLNHWGHLCFSSIFVQTALYIATDKLVESVRDVIIECPNPKSLFIFLGQHYGIKNKDRDGITSIKQIEVLLPYLNYLSDVDLYDLWDVCNVQGWFEYRKKHLDPILKTKDFQGSKFLTEEDTINSLNDLTNDEHYKSVDGYFWVNDYLNTVASVETVMDTIFTWIKSQDKIDFSIVRVSLDIILEIGSRRHYLKLLELCPDVFSSNTEYFNNAFFLLRTKQLH